MRIVGNIKHLCGLQLVFLITLCHLLYIPNSHLHALPAVILHTLYSTVERTEEAVNASTAEVVQRVPVIDIIVDCVSVNRGLHAFLFNVPIILLICLF